MSIILRMIWERLKIFFNKAIQIGTIQIMNIAVYLKSVMIYQPKGVHLWKKKLLENFHLLVMLI